MRIFSSMERFRKHLLSDHNSFGEAQLPFLMVSGKHPSLFPFLICPFCNTPDLDLRAIENLYEMTDDTYMHLEKSQKLQKHIGVHVLNFSLLALLEAEQEIDDMVSDVMNVESERRRSLSNVSSAARDSRDGLSDSEYVEFEETLPFNQTSILVPELEDEVQWDSIPKSEDAEVLPADDPKLATFVERFIATSPNLEGLLTVEQIGESRTAGTLTCNNFTV